MVEWRRLGGPKTRTDARVHAHFLASLPKFGVFLFFGGIGPEGENAFADYPVFRRCRDTLDQPRLRTPAPSRPVFSVFSVSPTAASGCRVEAKGMAIKSDACLLYLFAQDRHYVVFFKF